MLTRKNKTQSLAKNLQHRCQVDQIGSCVINQGFTNFPTGIVFFYSIIDSTLSNFVDEVEKEEVDVNLHLRQAIATFTATESTVIQPRISTHSRSHIDAGIGTGNDKSFGKCIAVTTPRTILKESLSDSDYQTTSGSNEKKKRLPIEKNSPTLFPADNRLFVRLPQEHEWRELSPAGIREVIVQKLAISPSLFGKVKPIHSGFALSPSGTEAREAILNISDNDSKVTLGQGVSLHKWIADLQSALVRKRCIGHVFHDIHKIKAIVTPVISEKGSFSIEAYAVAVSEYELERKKFQEGEIEARSILVAQIERVICPPNVMNMTTKKIYEHVLSVREEGANTPWETSVRELLTKKLTLNADNYCNSFMKYYLDANNAAQSVPPPNAEGLNGDLGVFFEI
ncbi:hypothetical protein EPUL_002819 [Erysiphe pulchra]|uniref:Uncharacterized protein n=1 Tax=Erysiphe pulchra TaxID=225359 RepID=A0A2S4PU97_9PEZI|nr:hypothetical protein EPUL_002819 [Erysiphe pulchra]